MNGRSRLLLQRGHQLSRRILAITLGVILCPPPQILTHIVQRPLGLPAKLIVGAGRVGREIQHVTATSRGDLVLELVAHSLGEGVDHFIDGAA